ncbi:hypothetical protein HHK36_030642 [Tetracentron sinense]|uniref:Uncharacterized protein n=1 Tax=Tetracentron sinense TaxID=13715 RepID=A0A834YC21_TETSI|nr:hypothetical protein HHK36_030642 [Tetracentron sinense]
MIGFIVECDVLCARISSLTLSDMELCKLDYKMFIEGSFLGLSHPHWHKLQTWFAKAIALEGDSPSRRLCRIIIGATSKYLIEGDF